MTDEHSPNPDRGVHITMLAGFCPVQADGTIDGQKFYFRARGESWSIGIGGDLLAKPDWHHEQPYGDAPFAAGYMDLEEARAFIDEAAERYRASKDATPVISDP